MGLPPTEHISLDIPCHRHYPGRSDGVYSLVPRHRQRPSLSKSRVGSCNCFFGPAQRSLTLWPVRSPSRLATPSIESSDSFVTSAALRLLPGRANQFPGGSCTRRSPAPFTAHFIANYGGLRLGLCCSIEASPPTTCQRTVKAGIRTVSVQFCSDEGRNPALSWLHWVTLMP